LLGGISGTVISARAQTVPTDAAPYCAVPPPAFNQWFQSGSAALGGMVLPPNSVAFSNPAKDNCPFYQWAEQMFLWATSPIPSQPGSGYGGFVPANGATPNIFDSTAFFDVSPSDGNGTAPPGCVPQGNRTLVPHPIIRQFTRRAVPRVRQVGPNGLPILMSKIGMLEVETQRQGPTGKALVTDAYDKPVEIARVRIDRKRARATLFDAQGNRIAFPLKTPSGRNTSRPIRVMALPTICKAATPCSGGAGGFIDTATGSIIETESAQAQGGPNLTPVLEAQTNSLVYYSIMVNDVYAWFLAGTNSGGISPKPSHFPTTQSDLKDITTFAGQGASFPDASVLTVELKASWIEASKLPPGAAATYITTQATVPTYKMPNTQQWTPTGQTRTTTLALVGMHIAGSVFGHPEMIFATFEHLGNTPNAKYSYISTFRRRPIRGSQTIPVPQDTSGNWLPTASGSSGPFNMAHMAQVAGGLIEAQSLQVPVGRVRSWNGHMPSAPATRSG
jgi:hypothetical protein